MIYLLCTAAGAALLMLVVFDIYATVLHASARYGPVGERLNRNVWRVMRWTAMRFGRHTRHRILNAIGPLLLPLLVTVYIALLILAFALIYYPRMPEHFFYAGETATHSFFEAFYFSGVTLTTLGYGEIIPVSAQVRLLAIIEAASGFALISLTVAYLLSVYNALERKRAMALSLYHEAHEGADVAALVAHHFVEGEFYGLRDALRQATRDIQALLEAHVEHPVIHYFHPLEIYKGLPRILFLLLETCAVIRSALNAEEYSDLRNYPEVRTLEASAVHVVEDLSESLDVERRERPRRLREDEAAEDEARWRRRYNHHLKQLAAAGIKTRGESEEGWLEYSKRRRLWESKLNRLSTYLGYEWDEISGDADLEYAHDEEQEKTQ